MDFNKDVRAVQDELQNRY